ncbi:MAG TPA: SDR family oxidoreductase [Fervidobacterium sp.]|nr:short-chain dehydrogenase [Fervidobacterium sp.]HOK87538.1 SDR family oxidoreductase [Fervidobacterium sp.]HOM73736.1 SDR family oxidoreductase [Fervidobacterium sp.]HOQ39191.1 SDR family oxidoreductase [Fervidobacterium sp.]HPP17513.1 SDR family oxidoreductase [Fervidobacterium sp.]
MGKYNKYNLKNYKWAMVTGASSGIGKQFAIQLAKKGLNTVLIGRNTEALTEVADSIHKNSNSSVVIIGGDLVSDIDMIIDNTRKFNVNLLINCAGRGLYGDFVDYECDDYEKMIRLNIEVLTKLSYHYTKQMIQTQEGGIINIASVAGFLPMPHFSVYAATKAYVYNFSLALWAELKPSNIHVLCVAPGKTQTQFFERAKMDPGRKLMSPEKVVAGALKAYEKGSPLYIPGFGNKLVYQVVRRLFTDKFITNILEEYF